jgi:hypothetical protein
MDACGNSLESVPHLDWSENPNQNDESRGSALLLSRAIRNKLPTSVFVESVVTYTNNKVVLLNFEIKSNRFHKLDFAQSVRKLVSIPTAVVSGKIESIKSTCIHT